MPWKGVTVSEQRQRFLEDHQLNYYSIRELAARFGISRKTAHKWIARFEQEGQTGWRIGSRAWPADVRENPCGFARFRRAAWLEAVRQLRQVLTR